MQPVPAADGLFDPVRADAKLWQELRQRAALLDRMPSHRTRYASEFRAHADAWAFFQTQPASYRRTLTWWVINAKQEATRQRRLLQLITESAAGRRVGAAL